MFFLLVIVIFSLFILTPLFLLLLLVFLLFLFLLLLFLLMIFVFLLIILCRLFSPRSFYRTWIIGSLCRLVSAGPTCASSLLGIWIMRRTFLDGTGKLFLGFVWTWKI